MKRIFTSPHLIEIVQLKDFLEREGVASSVMNENGAFNAQGEIDLCMPELWLHDDHDLARAVELSQEFQNLRATVEE